MTNCSSTFTDFNREKCSAARGAFLAHCRETIHHFKTNIDVEQLTWDWCPLSTTLCLCFCSVDQAIEFRHAVVRPAEQFYKIADCIFGPDPALLEPQEVKALKFYKTRLNDRRTRNCQSDFQKRLLYALTKAQVCGESTDEFIPGTSQQIAREGLLNLVRIGGE